MTFIKTNIVFLLRHIDVVHINKKPHLLIIENDEVPLLYEMRL